MALRRIIQEFLADSGGATAVEYGLVGGLMAIAIIGGLANFADANNRTYEKIEAEMSAVM